MRPQILVFEMEGDPGVAGEDSGNEQGKEKSLSERHRVRGLVYLLEVYLWRYVASLAQAFSLESRCPRRSLPLLRTRQEFKSKFQVPIGRG